MQVNGFESICKVIKRVGDHIDYYEAVKIAYSESEEFREYLGSDVADIKHIDKNPKNLWPFTYRIVNEPRKMIQLTGVQTIC